MSGIGEARFRTGILTPENIIPFTPRETDNVFIIIGVKQGVKISRTYGARVISGGTEVLEHFARKGVIVKKIYVTSRTQDGIRLSRGLGFKQVIPNQEDDDLLRFEFNLETTTSPYFQKYQRIVQNKQLNSKKTQNKDSGLIPTNEDKKTTA